MATLLKGIQKCLVIEKNLNKILCPSINCACDEKLGCDHLQWANSELIAPLSIFQCQWCTELTVIVSVDKVLYKGFQKGS